MRKETMFKIVKELEFDKEKMIYKEDDFEIFLFRPSRLSIRFSDYDVNKNFQIWIKDGNRKFRPNHLRVLIDLNLRIRSNPELKEKLLLTFDNIFYGKDPEKELKEFEKIKFEHFLNPIKVIGILAQLFHIEQEYAYARESKFDPPNLFFQGWIREFIDNPKEIDNLCMSICNRQPPMTKYTFKENKKHKKYNPQLLALWYMENQTNL